MTTIVNRGAPDLTLKRQLKAEVSCPNCPNMMVLDADEIDIGHIVKCEACHNNTYYPFEKPWYRRTRLVVGLVVSLVVSFFLGLASNYVYDYFNKSDVSDPSTLTQTQD